MPFALRDQMANAFGVEAEKFLVHPCNIGGDFGGKGDFMDVPVAYLAFAEDPQAGENGDGLRR